MSPTLRIIWSLGTLALAVAAIVWVLWTWLRKSDDAKSLVVRWIASLAVLLPLIAFAAGANDPISKIAAILAGAFGGLVLGVIWIPSLVEWVGGFFASFYTGGDVPPDPEPFYSIAEAKRKMGRYDESIAEIRRQLEMFPTDFRGWMMVAEIQAENLGDLPAARNTVDELLAQEGHPPKNHAFALNRLADWNLKLAKDPEAARGCLEMIILRFPDSELSHAAQQRVAHLASPEHLLDQADRPRIQVRAFDRKLGLEDDGAKSRPVEDDQAAAAHKLVEHLNIHPQDVEAREKLALIYANHYRRLDMATAELEQLLAIPNQPPKHVAHWLNTMADLQIRLGAGTEAARASLEKIIALFPTAAVAQNARQRIALLKTEARQNEKSQAVKLGSYENNLGLKDRP